MIRALFWKELREARWKCYGSVGVLFLLILGEKLFFLAGIAAKDRRVFDVLAKVVQMAPILFGACVILAVGSSRFAGERERKTLLLLESLPIPRRSIWLSKFLVGLLWVLVFTIIAWLALFDLGLLHIPGDTLDTFHTLRYIEESGGQIDSYDPTRMMIVVQQLLPGILITGWVLLTLYATSLFCSVWSPGVAVCLIYTLVGFGVMWAGGASLFLWLENSHRIGNLYSTGFYFTLSVNMVPLPVWATIGGYLLYVKPRLITQMLVLVSTVFMSTGWTWLASEVIWPFQQSVESRVVQTTPSVFLEASTIFSRLDDKAFERLSQLVTQTDDPAAAVGTIWLALAEYHSPLRIRTRRVFHESIEVSDPPAHQPFLQWSHAMRIQLTRWPASSPLPVGVLRLLYPIKERGLTNLFPWNRRLASSRFEAMRMNPYRKIWLISPRPSLSVEEPRWHDPMNAVYWYRQITTNAIGNTNGTLLRKALELSTYDTYELERLRGALKTLVSIGLSTREAKTVVHAFLLSRSHSSDSALKETFTSLFREAFNRSGFFEDLDARTKADRVVRAIQRVVHQIESNAYTPVGARDWLEWRRWALRAQMTVQETLDHPSDQQRKGWLKTLAKEDLLKERFEEYLRQTADARPEVRDRWMEDLLARRIHFPTLIKTWEREGADRLLK